MKRRGLLLLPLSEVQLRPALAAFAAAALIAIGLLTPGSAHATFGVDGEVTQIKTVIGGPCQPGQLDSSSTITQSQVVSASSNTVVTLESTGDVTGCLGTTTVPGLVAIGSGSNAELFSFRNVFVEASAQIPGTATFKLMVQDATGQDDFPSNFPSSGTLIVGEEELQYDSLTPGSCTTNCTGFNITSRDCNTCSYGVGSQVRAQGRLVLLARGLAKYTPGDITGDGDVDIADFIAENNRIIAESEPYTIFTQASGNWVNAPVSSPDTYLTCRALLSDNAGLITSSSRCHAILEPGYSGGPNDPFWPDLVPLVGVGPANAYNGPPLPLIPDGVYHEASFGSISGGGLLVLTTEDEDGRSCVPFIEDQLWFAITTTVQLDKIAENEELGELRVATYVEATCSTASTLPVMGVLNNLPGEATGTNFSATELPDGADSDGDGCTDEQELSSNPAGGGLRDPLNQWDYFNPLAASGSPGDGVNRIPDIVKAVTQFGQDSPAPSYDILSDRGGQMAHPGGSTAGWSLRPPNGTTRIPDIVAAVNSFGHDCSPVPGWNPGDPPP